MRTAPRAAVRRTRSARCAVAGLVLLAAAARVAADGGLVRVSERAGPFVITVFSTPTPLRAGPADFSVLVQRADGGEAVLDTAVALQLQRDASDAPPITVEATRAQATNKLLYAALVDIPTAGAWTVEVAVGAPPRRATVTFTAEVAAAPPPWQAFWPWFVLPVLGIGVFALQQWLALRQEARRHRD